MIPAILSLAALAVAAPVVERQSGPTDTQILNYALTLEHLENTFYKAGLQNFTREDFIKAGTEDVFYKNLKEISHDEQTHVDFLTSALGSNATAACEYDFGVTDAKSFLATAALLEGVGVSAYLGAAQYIADKTYLTYAGSILTVEARHSAYLRSNQPHKMTPFPSPFDIPLDFDQVYSLAALFITSCPSSNPALPVMKFPSLSASPATVHKAGQKLKLTIESGAKQASAAWFITTTGPVQADYDPTSCVVTVPTGIQAGQEYLVLTGDNNKPTDDNTVAGPAVVQVMQKYNQAN